MPQIGCGLSNKRYVVRLSKREREDLSALVKHKINALKRRHARVLLKVDEASK